MGRKKKFKLKHKPAGARTKTQWGLMLTARRVELGISQVELAARSRISAARISQYEMDPHPWTMQVESVIRIAQIYRMKILSLLQFVAELHLEHEEKRIKERAKEARASSTG